MSTAPLTLAQFDETVRRLEALRYREVQLVLADAQGAPLRAFQGYDALKTDLAGILGIRIAFENKALQTAAVLKPDTLESQFDAEDLAALRENVAREFGADLWPSHQKLDFVVLMRVLEATQKALAEKEKIILGSPRGLQWDFEERTKDRQIEAVRTCNLVGVYDRLSATLVHLIENRPDADSSAHILIRPITRLEEFDFAVADVALPGSWILPEIGLDEARQPMLN